MLNASPAIFVRHTPCHTVHEPVFASPKNGMHKKA